MRAPTRRTSGTAGTLPPVAGVTNLKILLVLLFLGVLAAQGLRLAGRDALPATGPSRSAEVAPAGGGGFAGPGGPFPAPGPGSRPGPSDEAGQAALMVFLGRDHSLVRRSVGFAWALDRLRSSQPYRLTPVQLETLTPLVRQLVEDARAEHDSILELRAWLTAEQVAFLNNPGEPHGRGGLVPMGPDVLPSEGFKALLGALRERASDRAPRGVPVAGAGAAPAPTAEGSADYDPGLAGGPYVPAAVGRNPAPALVSSWSDFLERPPTLAAALTAMEARKDLAFSPDQAGRLVPVLQRLVLAVERYDQVTRRFTAGLTAEQIRYLRACFQERGMPDDFAVNVLLELLSPR